MISLLKYEKRPWGRMWTIFGTSRFWLKFLIVGSSTSLQSHSGRTEWHFGFYKITPKNKPHILPGAYIKLVSGKKPPLGSSINEDGRYEWHFGLYRVMPQEKHRLFRGVYFEFVHGANVDENDIVRYEDVYGRGQNQKKTVVVSGGFDPLHIGHLEMFREAKKLGDRLVVVLNCDSWLVRKKGKYLMSQNDRAALIRGIKYVDDVYILETDRDDVGEAIEKIRPHIFANGGDRKGENTIPEAKICKKLGVEMVFNIGPSGKIRSSSEILEEYIRKPSKIIQRGDFSWQKNIS